MEPASVEVTDPGVGGWQRMGEEMKSSSPALVGSAEKRPVVQGRAEPAVEPPEI